MSIELFMRAFLALTFSGIFAWDVFSRYDDEIGSENTKSDKQRYLPYLPSVLLPIFILICSILGLFFSERFRPREWHFPCVLVFFCISACSMPY